MSEAGNNGGGVRTALFFASFMTLIAAGVGFSVRGGVLADWSAQFGFTKAELGGITGGGLVGFGIMILLCSTLADTVGYKPLMIVAFLLHVLSAVVTLAASWVFQHHGKAATYECLYWGMFLFSLANGLCETVINPLAATLYPKQKTHYLNILHAGWPGGLIIGGLLAFCFVGEEAKLVRWPWEVSMALFLIPTLIYGLIMVFEPFPISEAKAAGVKFGTMAKEFLSPILLLLLFLHAMVGYVELGTDSWITNIMENVIPNSILLLVYTAGLMFVLRFFAGPIVEKINPLGLLLCSAVLGCAGLYLLGSSVAGWSVFAAATVYGLGKTFFWPTMLGVVGERFPKGGALAMGAMGGVGMLSAGLLGGPGIGYKQDYFASNYLKGEHPSTYERYVAADPKSFLFFPSVAGLDGAKVATLKDEGKDLQQRTEILEKEGKRVEDDKKLHALVEWWESAEAHVPEDKKPVLEAGDYGGRMALKWTALVPFSMAVGYLILVIYFRLKGGYRAEVLHGAPPDGERYTGGVVGPVE